MQNPGLAAPTPSHRATTPTAPYSRRPPSPPYITIPHLPRHELGRNAYTVAPSETNLNAIQLSKDDLAIVTRGKAQVAADMASTWNYEMRREAQSILDYMYIGPTSILRDHTFLKEKNISLAVIVRDSRMGSVPLLSVEKACTACNIEPYYINIENLYHLIHSFPEIIYNLNAHMIKVHNQSLAATGTPRTGSILMTCDTGNDRSAAIVAAYIMAVFGASMHKTVQFVNVQRFCCTFEEDIKRILQTWEDLLQAKADVSANQASLQNMAQRQKSKRGVDDMDMDEGGARLDSDMDRFVGRDAFAPFMDME
ncbi:hypothetical protein PWT90_04000 [Aphanocladium album]|nr:hypothetical protein PWT90_04000 [Aphanocladium album]